jgi:hypothetical protein
MRSEEEEKPKAWREMFWTKGRLDSGGKHVKDVQPSLSTRARGAAMVKLDPELGIGITCVGNVQRMCRECRENVHGTGRSELEDVAALPETELKIGETVACCQTEIPSFSSCCFLENSFSSLPFHFNLLFLQSLVDLSSPFPKLAGLRGCSYWSCPSVLPSSTPPPHLYPPTTLSFMN